MKDTNGIELVDPQSWWTPGPRTLAEAARRPWLPPSPTEIADVPAFSERLAELLGAPENDGHVAASVAHMADALRALRERWGFRLAYGFANTVLLAVAAHGEQEPIWVGAPVHTVPRGTSREAHAARRAAELAVRATLSPAQRLLVQYVFWTLAVGPSDHAGGRRGRPQGLIGLLVELVEMLPTEDLATRLARDVVAVHRGLDRPAPPDLAEIVRRHEGFLKVLRRLEDDLDEVVGGPSLTEDLNWREIIAEEGFQLTALRDSPVERGLLAGALKRRGYRLEPDGAITSIAEHDRPSGGVAVVRPAEADRTGGTLAQGDSEADAVFAAADAAARWRALAAGAELVARLADDQGWPWRVVSGVELANLLEAEAAETAYRQRTAVLRDTVPAGESMVRLIDTAADHGATRVAARLCETSGELATWPLVQTIDAMWMRQLHRLAELGSAQPSACLELGEALARSRGRGVVRAYVSDALPGQIGALAEARAGAAACGVAEELLEIAKAEFEHDDALDDVRRARVLAALGRSRRTIIMIGAHLAADGDAARGRLRALVAELVR